MHVSAIAPARAIEGGQITVVGSGFSVDGPSLPEVTVQGRRARVVFASGGRLSFLVPSGVPTGGPARVQFVGEDHDATFVNLAPPIATGLHQVDSPAIDPSGNLYFTFSGTRGQQVPVSIFKVGHTGTRETFSSGIINPTSLAVDDRGHLFVSSRFEGTVYRVHEDGSAEPFATDLGVACGLAFRSDGTLFVGDRTGTIFALDRYGRATPFASLPASVAAFHLALGADALYVAAPTLSPVDAIYRVGFDGRVSIYSKAFGRPQGLAVGPGGILYVVEALAGASGLYRLLDPDAPEFVLAGPALIGVAFDPLGGLVVCSGDTAYRLREYPV